MPAFAAVAILLTALITVGFLYRRDDELREHRASDARARLMLEHVGDLVTGTMPPAPSSSPTRPPVS